MTTIHKEYVIDEKGNKKSVLLPYSDWQNILEDLEELYDIRAYDKAKIKPSKPIPFKVAVDEIKKRKKA